MGVGGGGGLNCNVVNCWPNFSARILFEGLLKNSSISCLIFLYVEVLAPVYEMSVLQFT